MKEALKIIEQISSITDRALLFHSATGKDSIALLDLMHPHFKEIICVYMYTVKDMQHIGKYIGWAERRYHNARFIQIPHYAVFTYIKTGYLGCRQNPKQKKYNLEELTENIRSRFNIGWVFFGFKQSDSMNRRIMLRTYEEESINRKTQKCYPLSKYKNGDVLHYIEERGLIRPETYGGKLQSSGCDVSDIGYLLYLERCFPEDLKKLYAMYPMAQRIMFEYKKNED
ncbi:MAG: phosphoadenosine phosphosulfate reductase family protein [Bacteroidaceae bacterium]